VDPKLAIEDVAEAIKDLCFKSRLAQGGSDRLRRASPGHNNTYTPTTDLIRLNKPPSMSNNAQGKVIITSSTEPAEAGR
jgi:hypothetical protein